VTAVEAAIRPLAAHQHLQAVALLTDLATHVDAGRLRVAGRRLRYAVDPDGACASAGADFSRRYLHLSPLMDGMTALDGLLDAESAGVVATALAPFLVPVGPEDDRSTPQRRADGLVELVRLAVDAEGVPVLSGASAHLQVVVPLAALTGDGHQPSVLPDHPSGAGLLAAPTVDRLACDAQVSRIVMGPGSVPLELGRAQRLFSSHQRRALALRDGGCRFPGCPRPARFTDAHHVVSWLNGGQTDLANALLLCRFHHRLVHERGWRVSVDDQRIGAGGRVWFTGADGQQLTGDPIGP